MAVKITLTFLNGSLKGRKCEYSTKARCIIGRATDCDIQLPAGLEFMEASRHHCELDFEPPMVQVRDLGSRNGTFVNGNNIGKRPPRPEEGDEGSPGGWQVLKEGDELRVGGVVVRVDVSARQEREKVREPARGSGIWPFFRLWSRSATPC